MEENPGTYSEPQPLRAFKEPLRPVVPMTPGLLPPAYEPWLTDVAERMQCPLDYVTVGSLIVTASVIGTGCGIRPKAYDSWTVIPNLWGGVIGAPGSLKSPALKEVIQPLETLAHEALETYQSQHRAFQMERDLYNAAKETVKKNVMKSTQGEATLETFKERMNGLSEPEAPCCKRYLTNDTTVEKMHELLSQNPRGLLLFRDELVGRPIQV